MLELADEPGDGGHAGGPGLLAGRIDVVRQRDPRRVAGEERDLAGVRAVPSEATTLSKPAWWAISASV